MEIKYLLNPKKFILSFQNSLFLKLAFLSLTIDILETMIWFANSGELQKYLSFMNHLQGESVISSKTLIISFASIIFSSLITLFLFFLLSSIIALIINKIKGGGFYYKIINLFFYTIIFSSFMDLIRLSLSYVWMPNSLYIFFSWIGVIFFIYGIYLIVTNNTNSTKSLS